MEEDILALKNHITSFNIKDNSQYRVYPINDNVAVGIYKQKRLNGDQY